MSTQDGAGLGNSVLDLVITHQELVTTVLVPVAVDAVPARYRLVPCPECHLTIPTVDPAGPVTVALLGPAVCTTPQLCCPVFMPVTIDTLISRNEAVFRAPVRELPIIAVDPRCPGARCKWPQVVTAAEFPSPVFMAVAMYALHTIEKIPITTLESYFSGISNIIRDRDGNCCCSP